MAAVLLSVHPATLAPISWPTCYVPTKRPMRRPRRSRSGLIPYVMDRLEAGEIDLALVEWWGGSAWSDRTCLASRTADCHCRTGPPMVDLEKRNPRRPCGPSTPWGRTWQRDGTPLTRGPGCGGGEPRYPPPAWKHRGGQARGAGRHWHLDCDGKLRHGRGSCRVACGIAPEGHRPL